MATEIPTRPVDIAAASLRPGRGVGLLTRLSGRVRRRPTMAVFLLAFAARAAVAGVVYARRGGTLFNDDQMYNVLAADKASGHTALWGTTEAFLFRSVGSFLQPLTLLYRVFGEREIVGQLLAAVFGALAAALVFAIAARVTSRAAAAFAAVFLALLPSQVLFSSLILKDPLAWAGLAALGLVAMAAAEAEERRWLVGVGLAELAIVLFLGHVRPSTALVAAIALFVAVAVEPARHKRALVVVAAAILVFGPWLIGIGPAGINVMENRQPLGRVRSLNAYGADSGFVTPPTTVVYDPAPPVTGPDGLPAPQQPGTTISPPVGRVEVIAETPDGVGVGSDIRHLPRGLSVILTEPYPWQWSRNRRMLAAGLETIVWYPILALAVVGAVHAIWRRRLLYPLLSLLGTAFVYALTDGNFGTAYRHRGELVWAAAVLAAVGFDVVRRRWARRGPVPAGGGT